MNCTSTIFKISFSKFVAVLYSIWDISDSVDKRKNLKSKRTKDLPSVVCEPESGLVSHKAQIHVNESLTPYRKRLLGRILQFKRDHNYKFIWTTNGKILLKKYGGRSAEDYGVKYG